MAVAAAIVVATAIWLPAYRWFLLISIGIGAAVAGGLFLWHKLRPVKEDDVENKRPLGLSQPRGASSRLLVVTWFASLTEILSCTE